MAASKQPHRDYYCYVLFRETGLPFYVGKGRGNRWLVHENECRPGRSYKDNIIAAMLASGLEIPKVRVGDGLTHDAAIAMERALIAALGNYPAGILANRTAGGDGFSDPTGEISRRISRSLSGRKLGPYSSERIEKAAAPQRGKKRGRQPDDVQAKRSASLKASRSAGSHANAGMGGKNHRPETIVKMRAAALARVNDKFRERMANYGAASKGRRYRQPKHPETTPF